MRIDDRFLSFCSVTVRGNDFQGEISLPVLAEDQLILRDDYRNDVMAKGVIESMDEIVEILDVNIPSIYPEARKYFERLEIRKGMTINLKVLNEVVKRINKMVRYERRIEREVEEARELLLNRYEHLEELEEESKQREIVKTVENLIRLIQEKENVLV